VSSSQDRSAGTPKASRSAKVDLAAQVEQCYLNIGIALVEVGGSFDDVAKLTFYVVDWTPDKMPSEPRDPRVNNCHHSVTTVAAAVPGAP
jgi:enamine deaminase RidA (YjgF/YER057c/UK114 family)